MAGADPGVVLVEDAVADVVQEVLDMPVAPDPGASCSPLAVPGGRLKTMASVAAARPAPLVTLILSCTVAQVDSMGFVVRR